MCTVLGGDHNKDHSPLLAVDLQSLLLFLAKTNVQKLCRLYNVLLRCTMGDVQNLRRLYNVLLRCTMGDVETNNRICYLP